MATVPKISFPVPANAAGTEFSSSDALLDVLNGESSGLYLVGSQGMWHGGVHITNATVPWCALTGKNVSEQTYVHTPYKGEQAVRCMADGEIVAYRVCQDYDFIEWGNDKLYFSSSFVLVKHAIQPDENAEHGLTFHTLYMNLTPVSSYAQTDGDLRKTAKNQNYYATSADVQSNHSAGTLPLNTQVRLGEQVVTSESKHRQYGEVTVMADTGALKAGDKVWTVSDQGWLKPASDQGAAVPSWWNQCSPAIYPGTVNALLYKTSAGLKYYLSSADTEAGIHADTKAGSLDNGFPVFYDANNAALQFTRSDGRIFSLVTLGKDVAPQKKGDRAWVVSDNGNLVADSADSSAGQAVYGQVVNLPTPIKIAAGDSIGHLGFYELPKDNGKISRYQVHIECLSMDPKLSTFLTNPGNVGRDDPTYLSYPENAVLMMPDATGKMAATDRKTRAPGILTRSKVPGVDAEGHVLADNKGAEQYQIHPEGGWLAKGDVKQLSPYDLAGLGFMTLDKAPESFDLIDGIHHPDNVVKGILEQLYKAAQDETRSSHAMNQYNYKRLLDQIDNNHDGHYSEDEYLQAIHNPSYRSHLYRLIVKHPSEWYYGKEDPFWKGYLDTLTTDAPLWKAYTESFIEKMAWMKKVEGMGPEPWHMHPVVFLGAMNIRSDGVTYDQLKKVFPQASDEDLNTVVNELRGKLVTFKLDTPTRLRHFFSQIKGEVGPQMKGKTEGFQFSPDTLRSFSRYYRQHSAEADQDGYEKNAAGIKIRQADEQAIGRKHYLRLNGNRQSNPDDGYNFRGRGLIQITGYEKYHGFQSEYTGYWSDNVPDTVSSPEKINEMPYAIRSALWFWIKYKPYNADIGGGYNDVAGVTRVVNGADMGLAERRTAYTLCEQVFL